MATRRSLVLLGLTFFVLAIASCAPPSGLPDGPTPIPSLIPVTEVSSVLEPTAPSAYTILSYPARLPSAAQGQEIYASSCATCHGQDGSGAVSGARNFQDLDYMRGETANSFYAAVTEGRGQMPAFSDRLTSDERWDVVFYVWRFSTSTERLDQGRRVYEQVCAACHGPDGRGGLPNTPDFTSALVNAELKAEPGRFFCVLSEGEGAMPAFGESLSEDAHWQVLTYLGSLSP